MIVADIFPKEKTFQLNLQARVGGIIFYLPP